METTSALPWFFHYRKRWTLFSLLSENICFFQLVFNQSYKREIRMSVFHKQKHRNKLTRITYFSVEELIHILRKYTFVLSQKSMKNSEMHILRFRNFVPGILSQFRKSVFHYLRDAHVCLWLQSFPSQIGASVTFMGRWPTPGDRMMSSWTGGNWGNPPKCPYPGRDKKLEGIP